MGGLEAQCVDCRVQLQDDENYRCTECVAARTRARTMGHREAQPWPALPGRLNAGVVPFHQRTKPDVDFWIAVGIIGMVVVAVCW